MLAVIKDAVHFTVHDPFRTALVIEMTVHPHVPTVVEQFRHAVKISFGL